MMVLKSVVEEIQPANLAYVITFVDLDPENYTKEKIKAFFEHLFKFTPEFKVPEDKSIFLFHGKDGKNGYTKATTHAELNGWVEGLLPEAEKTQATVTKEFDLAKHNENINKSGDNEMIKALKFQLE